eukprot:TRINITY_DN62150_c0_g1_i1.p1 TRINITY_DN62150_c0_g1~~TRINITY_DN62150_c0_g1_i1.p1  ORF type:complete len:1115 (+),score=222.94 TRINITY_DN62150_c0_g1_i1:97-3441(+)
MSPSSRGSISEVRSPRSGGDYAQSVREELSEFNIFRPFHRSLIQELASRVKVATFEPGDVVLKQNTMCDSMLFIVTGKVELLVDGSMCQVLTSRMYVGEFNMLGVRDRSSVGLRALEACIIYELSHESFNNIPREHKDDMAVFEDIRVNYASASMDGVVRNTCDIFKGLSEATLHAIDKTMVHRLYFPDSHVMTQGQPGEELFILLRGTVEVISNNKIVRVVTRGKPMQTPKPKNSKKLLKKGQINEDIVSEIDYQQSGEDVLCFGELGLIKLQKVRSASIVAQTVCHVGIVFRPLFVKTLDNHGEALNPRNMVKIFADRYDCKMMMMQRVRLQDLDLLKQVGCSTAFIDYLAENVEELIFLEDQHIVEQESESGEDKSMYIITSGVAKILKDGKEVAELRKGDVFGEAVLLGMATKRSSTVVAKEACIVQVLHQHVVIKGMELFPSDRQKFLMIAFQKSTPVSEGKKFKSPAPGNSKTKVSGQDDFHSKQKKIVATALSNSELFNNVTPEFVDDLQKVSTDRIYMPADHIIEEGSLGDSMFIMISGKAIVYVSTPETDPSKPAGRQYIGRLEAGSISGELAMLGVSQRRSATIEAETICCMWEVSQDSAMPVITKYADMQRSFLDTIIVHLEHTVPACIDGLSIFNEMDRKFRLLLGLYCDRRAYFNGNQIFKEGQAADGLHVLNLGKALMECKGTQIQIFGTGSYFNVMNMLGLVRCCLCTLVAYQTCHVIVISPVEFNQALEQYPARAQVQEIKKRETAAYESFKQSVYRLCTRKAMWKTCAKFIAQDIAGKKDENEVNSSLRRVLTSWQRHVSRMVKQRRKARRQNLVFENWVQQKREAVALRKYADTVSDGGVLEPLTAVNLEASSFGPRIPTVAATVVAAVGAGGGGNGGGSVGSGGGCSGGGGAGSAAWREQTSCRNDGLSLREACRGELANVGTPRVPNSLSEKHGTLFNLYLTDPRSRSASSTAPTPVPSPPSARRKRGVPAPPRGMLPFLSPGGVGGCGGSSAPPIVATAAGTGASARDGADAGFVGGGDTGQGGGCGGGAGSGGASDVRGIENPPAQCRASSAPSAKQRPRGKTSGVMVLAWGNQEKAVTLPDTSALWQAMSG